jgi:hypothetical protein
MPDDKPISGPLFIAVGEDGIRCFSRDGRAWTNLKTGRDGEVFDTAAFGKGTCIIGARFGGSYTSACTRDGVEWKSSTYDAKYTNYIRTIVFFNDRFLGIGVTFIKPSADGLQWEAERKLPERRFLFGINPTFHRFAIGNGLLVGVGDFGCSAATKNGFDWDTTPDPKAPNTLIDVAFGNGVFVGSGMHGLRMRSADGLNWTDRVVGEEGEHINSMIWDGKQFVGVGQGATYISPDGLKWERIPNENAPTAATFGNGVYVGSLWEGRLMRSVDGIKWEQVTKLQNHVVCLQFGSLGQG